MKNKTEIYIAILILIEKVLIKILFGIQFSIQLIKKKNFIPQFMLENK